MPPRPSTSDTSYVPMCNFVGPAASFLPGSTVGAGAGGQFPADSVSVDGGAGWGGVVKRVASGGSCGGVMTATSGKDHSDIASRIPDHAALLPALSLTPEMLC